MSDEFPKGFISLFVQEIGEPRNNDLRIVVAEGLEGPEIMTDLGVATSVRPNQTSRVYELIWYNYVAFSVRNESYWQLEKGEEPSVDRLRTRTNSAYLAYVAATTFATHDYPGPLTHWTLGTEWHCIDVVSVDAPEIRLISGLESTDRAETQY